MIKYVSYRNFLYYNKMYSELSVGVHIGGFYIVDGKPELDEQCEFIRWIDDTYKTEMWEQEQ